MKNQDKKVLPAKNEPEEIHKFRHLLIEDVKYKTYYNRKFENRKVWKSPDPKKVISFIPGTILEVMVKPGQKVKKGDELLILDAMKMANHIKSNDAQVIRGVYIKAGDKVPKGLVMIEFE